MNLSSETLKNSRPLSDNDVPQAGDYVRWLPSKRHDWQAIGRSDTQLTNLPVATIRMRCGNPDMQFCTLAK